MKILVDMNLSPRWCPVFERQGWPSTHWSTVGDPRAVDTALLGWASEHGYILLTHDLDFSAVLAATNASGPSVVQVRIQDITPETHEALFVRILRQFEPALETGALIVVDPSRARARVLPLRS